MIVRQFLNTGFVSRSNLDSSAGGDTVTKCLINEPTIDKMQLIIRSNYTWVITGKKIGSLSIIL